MTLISVEDFSVTGLYVHVPFCKSRCPFCAFYLEIHRPASAAVFVDALLHEIAMYRRQETLAHQPVRSVYFGGGTPTTLSSGQLRSILTAIQESFSLERDVEVSIEAHPDSVTPGLLSQLRDMGFNRISFGAESMEPDDLRQMRRSGSPMDTVHAVVAARQAGFMNINLDLMYGLIGQTCASWRSSVHQAINLHPDHISCYALTVEDGTGLATAVENNRVIAPDADLQNEMEDMAEQQLAAAGYRRYEISNYHRDGSMCRHNLLYWTDGSYLGLGPSAQSFVGGLRYGNVADLDQYVDLLRRNILPHTEHDRLSPQQRAREAVIFGLRKTSGIPTHWLSRVQDPGWSDMIQRLMEQHVLQRSGDRLQLTSLGRRYADELAVRLL